jgi:hypothetical protein
MLLLNFHITFIANHDEAHLAVPIELSFLQPSGNIIEGFTICNIVDKNSSGS